MTSLQLYPQNSALKQKTDSLTAAENFANFANVARTKPIRRLKLILAKSHRLDAEVAKFVVALFPVGHEGIVGHQGTGLVEIGFDAVVYRYFGILTLREALAVFDDRATGGDVAAHFVLHPFDHCLYLPRFKGIGGIYSDGQGE